MTVAILHFSDITLVHMAKLRRFLAARWIFSVWIKEAGCTGLVYAPEIINKMKLDDDVR